MRRSATSRALSTVGGLHQHRELVAPEPGRGVPLADGVTQALTGDHEQLVAHLVPQAVVDVLEVVEVEVEHHDRLGRAHRALAQRVHQPVPEQLAVGQPGQRVVERLVGELLLEPLPVGDVAQRQHQAAHGRVGEQVVEGPLEGEVPPVRVPQPHQHGVLALAGGQRADEPRHVGRLEELGEAATGQPGRLHPEDSRGGRAHERRGGVGLEHRDEVGAVVHQRHQPSLTGVDDLAAP